MIRILPNISSNRLEESKEFYINFLGMSLAMDMKWILTFVSNLNPTAQISIVQDDKANHLNSTITSSIEVTNIIAFYEKV